jgi:RNA polymerase sigma factor (sigma-70 family)
MDLPDPHLFRQFQSSKDEFIWAEVSRRCTPWMLAVARCRCENIGIPTAEAEDVVQEAFSTVLSTKAQYDPEHGCSVQAYLRGHIKNAARSVLRQRSKLTMTEGDSGWETATDPHDELQQNEDVEFVRRVLLKGESPKMLSILQAIYRDGLTQQQVALAHGVAHTTIGRWLDGFFARAIKRAECAMGK